MSETTEIGVWKDGRTPRRRCTAKSSQTGLPCKRAPIEGGTVCGTHGGRAPAVKAAARARLENATLLLAKELLGMATDRELPDAVRLSAIKDALDRAGLGARAALDVTHEIPLWQQVLNGVYRGPRDSAPADPDGTRGSTAPIDAEVVDGEVIEYATFTDDDGREP